MTDLLMPPPTLLLLPARCASSERADARQRIRQAHAVLAFVGLCRAVADFKPEPEIVMVETPIQLELFDIQQTIRNLREFNSAVLALVESRPFDSTILKGIAHG